MLKCFKLKFSSPYICDTLPGLNFPNLFPLHLSCIMFCKSEVLYSRTCLHVKLLQGFRNCWDTRLTLTSETATMYPDIYVQETSVLGQREGSKDSITLRRVMEILQHRYSINYDFSSPCLQSDNSFRTFSLSKSPCMSLTIKDSFTFLLW